MEKVGPQHRRFDTIRPADFSHPALDADLAALRAEVMHGRGIVFINGLPVERYSVAEAESLFWGIGTHFGTGHSQSAAGDRMGHVADRTSELSGKQSGRGYLSRRHLSPHTDLTEILGMLSVRTSAEGGESVYGSATTFLTLVAANIRNTSPSTSAVSPITAATKRRPAPSPSRPTTCQSIRCVTKSQAVSMYVTS